MAKATSKAKSESATPPGNDQQTIDELQQRYQKLNHRKIQTETQREEAARRLEELKQEARAKYQTDDVEQLRQKLEEMKQENERKRANYQEDLDKIERDLESVEQKFGSTAALDEDQS